ncbi:hypothetical protein [Actinomadura sp. 6N118]|uniref:globin domain-containing protein n=1 Tax=Actinomadura sp. 6N118 TaxID=3375151 RepID=UPI003789702C
MTSIETGPQPVKPVEAPAGLYQACGGRDGFWRLVAAMHERIIVDDILQPLFAGADHQEPVTAWFVDALAHPDRARRGGGHRLLSAHQGHALTETQRRRYTAQMTASADDAGFADDPAVRAALVAWLEWGTRTALAAAHGHPTPQPPGWLLAAADDPTG